MRKSQLKWASLLCKAVTSLVESLGNSNCDSQHFDCISMLLLITSSVHWHNSWNDTCLNWEGLINVKLEVASSTIIESMIKCLNLMDSITDDCSGTDDFRCQCVFMRYLSIITSFSAINETFQNASLDTVDGCRCDSSNVQFLNSLNFKNRQWYLTE